jgi:malate synthase
LGQKPERVPATQLRVNSMSAIKHDSSALDAEQINTPEQIKLQRIIRRDLVEREQTLRRKRDAQNYHDHASNFNCLGDVFAKALRQDYA